MSHAPGENAGMEQQQTPANEDQKTESADLTNAELEQISGGAFVGGSVVTRPGGGTTSSSSTTGGTPDSLSPVVNTLDTIRDLMGVDSAAKRAALGI